MLISVDTGNKVTRLPHQKDFDRWMKRLNKEDYNKVVAELKSKISKGNIHTSGWMPGHDWTNTVYEPLYHACLMDINQSGMFFGLIVFKILMEDPYTTWYFGRFSKDGKEIGSITYFTSPTSQQ